MILQGDIVIGRRLYPKGSQVAWHVVYPFFLLHALAFGASGFAMAYARSHPPLVFLYLHGGFAIVIYTVLYVAVFGRDDVKWMFINAVLGVSGITTQIGWLLGLFGKRFDDYPYYVHVIPFLYFVLYTFLLRHAVIDLAQARGDPIKQKRAETAYVVLSIVVYASSFWWEARHR